MVWSGYTLQLQGVPMGAMRVTICDEEHVRRARSFRENASPDEGQACSAVLYTSITRPVQWQHQVQVTGTGTAQTRAHLDTDLGDAGLHQHSELGLKHGHHLGCGPEQVVKQAGKGRGRAQAYALEVVLQAIKAGRHAVRAMASSTTAHSAIVLPRTCHMLAYQPN
jgi:hypothetical protein